MNEGAFITAILVGVLGFIASALIIVPFHLPFATVLGINAAAWILGAAAGALIAKCLRQ